MAEKPVTTKNTTLRPFRIPQLSIHWLRYLLPLIILGLAIHLLIPQLSTIEESLNVIRGMNPILIGVAVLVETGSYASSGYLLHSLANLMDDELTIRRGMVLTLAGASVGLVAGGVVGTSAVVYRWTRNSGVKGETAALCGALPFVFLNLLLVLFAIAGIIQLFIVHELTTLETVAFGLTLIALIIAGVAIVFGMSHPTWLADRVSDIGHRWAAFRNKEFDPQAARPGEPACGYLDRINRRGMERAPSWEPRPWSCWICLCWGYCSWRPVTLSPSGCCWPATDSPCLSAVCLLCPVVSAWWKR
ncbi:MAG: hypothetical protein R3C44_22675 [Chloroflexota bacterium]